MKDNGFVDKSFNYNSRNALSEIIYSASKIQGLMVKIYVFIGAKWN